ncbi:hypothetical protein POVWA1_013340 [Plasmodium ovale wallikeri]|nr:hypothetical protein POVWA1_013340 [Plasmodium ovale wallikeri]
MRGFAYWHRHWHCQWQEGLGKRSRNGREKEEMGGKSRENSEGGPGMHKNGKYFIRGECPHKQTCPLDHPTCACACTCTHTYTRLRIRRAETCAFPSRAQHTSTIKCRQLIEAYHSL